MSYKERLSKLDAKKRKAYEWRIRRFKRFQFIIVLVVCTGILLFQSGQCVTKYLQYSTGTADKYVHISKTSFPVMTVCPTYPYNLDRLKYHGIETKSDIQFGAQWTSNDGTTDPTEFYDDVVMKVEDVVKEVVIYAEVVIDGTNKFTLKPNDTFCGEGLFKVKPYYFNGDCFALNLPTCLRDNGVLELVLHFYNKSDIFIHHPGQFLSPNSRSRVDVDLSKFVKIAVNHEVVQLLGEDGSCVEDYGDNADFDDCMYTNLRDISLKELNCTVPWLPDKSQICTDPEKMANAFRIYQNNRRNQNDLCPNSCLFTNMYFGPPVTGSNNAEHLTRATAVFYFRRDIKTTTEYYLYLALSMIAEIGGYVGLLLGVSLFKLAEINNLFIDWHIEKKEEKAVEAEEHSKKFGIDQVMFAKPNFNI